MKVERFFQEAGLKILAIANLNRCEYSICFYLLNCSVSGLDELITTESELASLMGFPEEELRQSLETLSAKNIIHIHYSLSKGKITENSSLSINLEYDTKKWNLETQHSEFSAKDAIVFPFRRKGEVNLQVIETKESQTKSGTKEAWQRVYESYIKNRSLDESDMKKAEEISKVLIETHPVDQVLLLVRHFSDRIPTLSLLASSWQHYQELFEKETQNVDLMGARIKHFELDQECREKAKKILLKEEEYNLNEEEINVLNILIKHQHPRRQLFWAYQVRSRYPNLNGFFEDTMDIMLPVTSSGHIIKRPSPEI